MAPFRYERLPTAPDTSNNLSTSSTQLEYDLGDEESNTGISRSPPPTRVVFARDSRFEIPTPPPWQRVALIAFVVFLFWLGHKLRGSPGEEGIPAIIE